MGREKISGTGSPARVEERKKTRHIKESIKVQKEEKLRNTEGFRLMARGEQISKSVLVQSRKRKCL